MATATSRSRSVRRSSCARAWRRRSPPSVPGAGSLSRRPLGYAIVGGLVFSTVLTLYVVPTVYVIFDAALARVGGRTRRQAALAAAEAE